MLFISHFTTSHTYVASLSPPHPSRTSTNTHAPFTCLPIYLVHGRTVSSKKTIQGAANWDIIRKVKNAVSIPVVANGGVETGADAERLLEETGADAVMSSEGLLEDPGLFDRSLTPMEELQGVEVGRVPRQLCFSPFVEGGSRRDLCGCICVERQRF